MRKFEYPELGEVLYQGRLSNGLRVLVAPRPGFSRKLAYFVTDFGAIHRNFRLEGQEIHAPAGIAHFLEHKMFELPDGRDVSAELAALGAVTNAFTSQFVGRTTDATLGVDVDAVAGATATSQAVVDAVNNITQ